MSRSLGKHSPQQQQQEQAWLEHLGEAAAAAGPEPGPRPTGASGVDADAGLWPAVEGCCACTEAWETGESGWRETEGCCCCCEFGGSLSLPERCSSAFICFMRPGAHSARWRAHMRVQRSRGCYELQEMHRLRSDSCAWLLEPLSLDSWCARPEQRSHPC